MKWDGLAKKFPTFLAMQNLYVIWLCNHLFSPVSTSSFLILAKKKKKKVNYMLNLTDIFSQNNFGLKKLYEFLIVHMLTENLLGCCNLGAVINAVINIQ